MKAVKQLGACTASATQQCMQAWISRRAQGGSMFAQRIRACSWRAANSLRSTAKCMRSSSSQCSTISTSYFSALCRQADQHGDGGGRRAVLCELWWMGTFRAVLEMAASWPSWPGRRGSGCHAAHTSGCHAAHSALGRCRPFAWIEAVHIHSPLKCSAASTYQRRGLALHGPGSLHDTLESRDEPPREQSGC